ncbi:MAG: hypothetical protein ACK5O8_03960, partial [Pirellula sp.]
EFKLRGGLTQDLRSRVRGNTQNQIASIRRLRQLLGLADRSRYPPMLVMINTSALAIPTRLRPALTLRALMVSLRDGAESIRLRIQSEPRV